MSKFATLRRRVFGRPGRLGVSVVGAAIVLADLALVVWAIQVHRHLGGGFGLPLSILYALLALGLVGLGVLLHAGRRRWKDAALAERLQEDEARLRLLASQLPADVWTTDTELRLTSASGALLARLEAPEARVPGRTLYEVFGTQDPGHPVIAAHLQALRGESVTYQRAAGPIVLEGRVEPLRDDRGGIIGCVGFAVDVTERKRAETALRESEERFRVALRDSAIFVGTMDRELRYTWAYNTRHGFRPEDVLGKRPDELIELDEAKGMMELLREVLSSGAGKRREVSGRTRGERWSYDQTVEPLRDERGEVIGLTLVAVDITERRAAEEHHRLLADALEGAGDMISVTDLENRFVYVNEAFLRTYGFTRDEVLGQTPALLGAPDSVRREILAQTLQGGWTGDLVNHRKDGAEVPVSLRTTLTRDSEGRVIGLLGVARDITERRGAEEALRKSQERFELAALATNEAIWELDFAAQETWWSPAFGRLFGFGPGEGTAGTAWWRERIHPEDRERALWKWKDAVDGGGIYWGDEYRLRCANGSYAAVMGRGYVVRDEAGRPVRMIGSLTDITERKRAEEAVARLASFPQMDPMPVVEVDTAGSVSFMNPVAERLFPDLREAPSLHPFVSGAWVLTGESQHEGRRLHSREVRVQETWYLQNIFALPDGSHLRIYATDITERRRAEEAVRKSERRFRTVLDSMRMIGLGLDAAGKITYCNDYLLEVTGWPRGEVIGCDWFDRFIPPDSGLREIFDRGIASGAMPAHHRNEILTRAGARRLVEWDSTLLRDSDGRLTGIVSIGEDVTERVRALEALQRSESELRALARHLESVREDEHTRMARGIHDGLGQALTALRLDLSWLARKLPEASAAVRQKIGAMVSLTDDTIEVGRSIAAELRPPILDDLGLAPSLEWYVQHFAKRAGLGYEWDPGPAELFVDREVAVIAYRIVQEALTNVARHAQAKHVAVRLGEQDGALMVEIQDDGRGVSEDTVASPHSLGFVGMRERALVRGGSLTVCRAPGGGTSVRVTIPIERRREPRAPR